jgi:4-hydroxymandelate oxidase
LERAFEQLRSAMLPAGTVNFPPSPMGVAFLASCSRFAERPAYRIDGEWITWAECALRVGRLASQLLSAFPQQTTRDGMPVVAALLRNSPLLMELFYAAALGNFAILPVNHRLTPSEIDDVLATGAAAWLVTSAGLLSKCEELAWYRLNGGRTLCQAATAPDSGLDVRWLERLPTGVEGAVVPVARGGPSIVEVFATSGSTGKVKVVPHTDVAVLTHAAATMAAFGLSAGDDHCWAHSGPMFHVGDVAFVWVGLLIGARHVFIENQLQLGLTVATLASEGVTMTKLTPSMLTLITESNAVEGMTFPSLQWVLTGGAKLDPGVAARAATALGCDVWQGYGMTEATCHIGFKNQTREGNEVGLKTLPGLEVRVITETGESARVGEVGEIGLRGPTVMAGYQRAGVHELDRSAFLSDGFLRSGDLGYLTSDGRLHVAGRVKDMINVGGENVFAAEVEQVVAQLPGAALCSAFALPDALLGEVVALAIEGDGGGLSEAAVRAHCRQKLASYKVPRTVVFLAQLPRTATGKVRKTALAEMIRPTTADANADAGSTGSQELTAFLTERIQCYLGHEMQNAITTDSNILELGIDSLNVIDLLLELETRYGFALSPTLLYDHPTVGGVVQYLADRGAAQRTRSTEPPAQKSPSTPTSTPAATVRQAGIVSCALQALGLLVRPTLMALSSIPVLILAIMAAQSEGALVALALSPLWVSLHMLLMMLLTAAAVRVLDPGPTDFPLWGARYCGWLTAQNLLRGQDDVLGLLRGTAALSFYYRLLGARIGAGVRIDTLGLTDPRFITVDAGVSIGREAVLQPAVISTVSVSRAPIQIGEGAVICPGAQLVGEAMVPPQGVVGVLGTSVTETSRDVSAASRVQGLCASIGAAYVYGLSVAVGLELISFLTDQSVTALPGRLAEVVVGGSSLRWSELLSVAVTLQLVLPLVTFLLVVGVVCPLRALLERLGRPVIGASVYRSAIEVPFFAVWLRLTVMSPLTGFNFRLLGATVGDDTMLAGPYVEDPRQLRIGDGAILAGNVTVLNGSRGLALADAVEVRRQGIVANSCILTNGAVVPERSLLGDLSGLSAGTVLPEGSVAVGASARVVGRSRFHEPELSGPARFTAKILLAPAQLLVSALISILGFVAFAAVLQAQVLPGIWNALWALPVALLVRRLVRIVALVGLKWAVMGRIVAGDHLLMGVMYSRWVFLEALIMDAERAILVSMRGTVYLAALWRLLGARIGRGACLMGSSLGCEFDLKSIGMGTVLQPNAMVFAHSVEHHTLLFRATRIGDGVNVGPNSIVEAGADVANAIRVPANRAVHARPLVDAAGATSSPDDCGGDPVALEQQARERLAPAIFNYFSNGSESGRALRRNLDVLKSIAICPRRLRDVSNISLETTLFGRELSSPILVAPTAMHRLLHTDGEAAVGRATERRNAGMVLSMLSTMPLEQVVRPFGSGRGLALFQLYMLKDRGLTDALVQRAEAAGYHGLVVTVDSPASGRMDIDPREWLRFSQALELVHLPTLTDTHVPPLVRFESMKDASLKFSDLVALQSRTKLPICLKGILSPSDAVLAASLGFQTLILSNHGGRRLDDEVSAIEMVMPVRLALDKAGHDIRLLADGGIRNGSDAFKAIALGADAVLVGRAPLWGLTAAGESGVARVLQRLDDELALTMKLAGCSMLAELTPDLLHFHSSDRAVTLS